MVKRDKLKAGKIFNQNAEYYISRESKNPNRKYLEKVLKSVMEDVSGKKILDIGCSDGRNAMWLSKKGATVIGTDISERMIEIARMNCIDSDAEFFVSDMENVGLPDNEVDIILSIFSIMYKKNFENLIKEFHRILKNNGELILVVPHPLRKIVKHTGDYFKNGKYWEDYGKMKIFGYHKTFEEYLNNLIKNGFNIKELRELKNRDKWNKFVFPEYLLIRATLRQM